ncbi:MAG TPA: class I SAM-dependent methyltransferase [Cyclobacteriaceae bacterium]|nr:class I SAM-dependent methyltransferase [Cyclobacteriaceae bacterium]
MKLLQKIILRVNDYKRKRKVKNNHQRDVSIKNAHYLHRTNHAGEYIEIDEIVKKFRESGGLKHDFQAYKLWHLKQLISNHKPNSILELGSGSSTVIFADYVRKNENRRLLSIDEDEKWVSNTKSLINYDKNDKIEVISALKKFIGDSIPNEIKYDIKIEGNFDLVFIDGPSLEVNGEKKKDAVNTNVFELQNYPEIIIVDVRKATAEYLSRRYQQKYKVWLSDLLSGKPVKENYNYFSIFTRK